jgi:hypothetical protein
VNPAAGLGTAPPDAALVKQADDFTSPKATIGERMKAWKAISEAADAKPESLPKPFGMLLAEGLEALAGTGQSKGFQKSLERAHLGKAALSSIAAHAHKAMAGAAGDTELGRTLSRRLRKEMIGQNSDPAMRRELLSHAAEAHDALSSNPVLQESWRATALTALHSTLLYDGVTMSMLRNEQDGRSTQYLESLRKGLS